MRSKTTIDRDHRNSAGSESSLLAWADDSARGELRSIRRCVSGHGSRRHFVSIWSRFPLVVIAGGIGDRSRTATLAREMECRSGTGHAAHGLVIAVWIAAAAFAAVDKELEFAARN